MRSRLAFSFLMICRLMTWIALQGVLVLHAGYPPSLNLSFRFVGSLNPLAEDHAVVPQLRDAGRLGSDPARIRLRCRSLSFEPSLRRNLSSTRAWRYSCLSCVYYNIFCQFLPSFIGF